MLYAAVDREHRSGYESRVVTCEERYGTGEFLKGAEATEGHMSEAAEAFRLSNPREDVCELRRFARA